MHKAGRGALFPERPLDSPSKRLNYAKDLPASSHQVRSLEVGVLEDRPHGLGSGSEWDQLGS